MIVQPRLPSLSVNQLWFNGCVLLPPAFHCGEEMRPGKKCITAGAAESI